MSSFKVAEDLLDLFPLKTDKRAESNSSQSSRFRSGKPKRIEVHSNVREMTSPLNYISNDIVGYERATVNCIKASSE